jgi:hypothetical protein
MHYSIVSIEYSMNTIESRIEYGKALDSMGLTTIVS